MSGWLVGWFLKCFHETAEHSTRSFVGFKGETSILLKLVRFQLWQFFSWSFFYIFLYFPSIILGSLAWELSPQQPRVFQGSSRIRGSEVIPSFPHWAGHEPPKSQSSLSCREWLPGTEFLHLSRKLGAAPCAVVNISLTCWSQHSGRKDLIKFKQTIYLPSLLSTAAKQQELDLPVSWQGPRSFMGWS